MKVVPCLAHILRMPSLRLVKRVLNAVNDFATTSVTCAQTCMFPRGVLRTFLTSSTDWGQEACWPKKQTILS